jgi:hypothetical protein
MTTMATRSRWTDERLDDAFTQLRAELREFKLEVREQLREIRHELRETRRWMIGLMASYILGVVAILVELGIQD